MSQTSNAYAYSGGDLERELSRARTEGTHEERIRSLENWNNMQNSRLTRIEDKIDKMIWVALGGLIACLGALFAQIAPHIPLK